jgi:hypothetical protein
MKYRLTAFIVFLTFILASCSLAEDITPPPGYQSPSSVPSLALTTKMPQATLTTEPATVTPDVSPATPLSSTPIAEVTTPSRSAIGNISGNLVNGSGGTIPEGQKVTLVGFDVDQSGNYQKVVEQVTTVDPAGSFSFRGVEVPQERAFLIITSLGDIEFQSEPVIVSDTKTDFSVPITIYDKTDDWTPLSLSQVHLIYDSSSQDVLQVVELYIVNNTGKQAVFIPSDGTAIPFIHVPEKASSVQYQLSQGSAELVNAKGGFAILPGAEKQYGFIATYTLPYSRNLKIEQLFSLPVSSLTVFIPQGMRLRSEQLVEAGKQDIQGKSYQLYQANKIASGSTVSLTLSGKSGESTGFAFNRQTLVLIGIGVVGVLLLGLGIYLYLRDRARFRKENEASNEEIEKDALGEDRDSIMDAMIALDDQFKAGEIPREAYDTRRLELKERLKQAL